MDARKIILLVGALVVAAITAFMARNLMAGSSTPIAGAVPVAGAPQSTNEVLVATRALPVGTILDPQSMKWVPWPKDLIEGAYFQKEQTDPKTLQGTVVRFAIPAGQPLTQGALVKPGDRVDLILTQEVPGGGDGPPLKASETVLRNVRVLATDQRTDQQHDDKGNTVVATYSTVTVEATPKIAEQIAVAQTLGSLSLSLRSIADNQGELEDAIASGEVNVPTKGGAKAEQEMMASVAARPQEGGSSVSTGADVSRFQRRTVPSKPPADRPSMAGAAPAPGQTYPGAPPPVALGPVVRVVRGSDATVVPVGGKN